jgi:hypothetical protein
MEQEIKPNPAQFTVAVVVIREREKYMPNFSRPKRVLESHESSSTLEILAVLLACLISVILERVISSNTKLDGKQRSADKGIRWVDSARIFYCEQMSALDSNCVSKFRFFFSMVCTSE